MIRKLLSLALYGLFLTALFAGVLALFFAVVGCVENRPPAPRGIAATGTAVDKATAHVESADAAVVKARTESSSVGQSLLGVAQEEHAKALSNLADANADLAQAESDFDLEHAARLSAEAEVVKTKAELAKVKSGWGYRLQTFVAWLWLILSIGIPLLLLGAGALWYFTGGAIGIIPKIIGGVLGGVIHVITGGLTYFAQLRGKKIAAAQATTEAVANA